MGWRFFSKDWFRDDSRDDGRDSQRQSPQRRAEHEDEGDDSKDKSVLQKPLNTDLPEWSEARNPNLFSDTWFCDGCHFSEDGMAIHSASGQPLAYFVAATNSFHYYSDGSLAFYYDLFGEQIHRGGPRIFTR